MRRLGLFMLVLTLFTACPAADDDAARDEPTSEATSLPRKTASSETPYTVQIFAPAAGSTVEGTSVLVQVAIEGEFEVADKLGEEAKKGEGHVHYYLDVENIPTEAGRPAVTGDEKTYHATASTAYTWQEVEPGEHTLGAQLVNNDHTPLDPPVTDEIDITVKG